MRSFITGMMQYVKDKETMDAVALGLKAQEEMGEWAKDVLMENGYLRHKDHVPEMFEEWADVFMVMVAAMMQSRPEMSAEQFVEELDHALKKKFQKYHTLLETGQVDKLLPKLKVEAPENVVINYGYDPEA